MEATNLYNVVKYSVRDGKAFRTEPIYTHADGDLGYGPVTLAQAQESCDILNSDEIATALSPDGMKIWGYRPSLIREEPKQRGGKREGAGRKPAEAGNPRNRRVTAWIDAGTERRLDHEAQGRGITISELVAEKLKR